MSRRSKEMVEIHLSELKDRVLENPGRTSSQLGMLVKRADRGKVHQDLVRLERRGEIHAVIKQERVGTVSYWYIGRNEKRQSIRELQQEHNQFIRLGYKRIEF